MKQKNPSGKFYDCPFLDKAGCTLCNTCPYMALNTLEKLYLVMKNQNNEIILDEDLMNKARGSLTRMLEMS